MLETKTKKLWSSNHFILVQDINSFPYFTFVNHPRPMFVLADAWISVKIYATLWMLQQATNWKKVNMKVGMKKTLERTRLGPEIIVSILNTVILVPFGRMKNMFSKYVYEGKKTWEVQAICDVSPEFNIQELELFLSNPTTSAVMNWTELTKFFPNAFQFCEVLIYSDGSLGEIINTFFNKNVWWPFFRWNMSIR